MKQQIHYAVTTLKVAYAGFLVDANLNLALQMEKMEFA
jgi:hypothetical protein